MITKSELRASLERSKKRSKTLAQKLKALTESYSNQEKEDARTIRKLELKSSKLEKICRQLEFDNKELAKANRRIDELVEKNTKLQMYYDKEEDRKRELKRLNYHPPAIDVTQGHIVETPFDHLPVKG
jgi:chromosome segregation ATPase